MRTLAIVAIAVAAISIAVPATGADTVTQQLADLHDQVAGLESDVSTISDKADSSYALTRCIKAAERVAFHVATVNGRRERVMVDVPDFPGVKGSFWILMIHPACMHAPPEARHGNP